MPAHNESLKRFYSREEDFLREFEAGELIWEVVHAVGPYEWQPAFDCDDNVRKQREDFKDSGDPKVLTFECAAVYSTSGESFSSILVTLVSSQTVVNVEVRWAGQKLIAEKISDSPRLKK